MGFISAMLCLGGSSTRKFPGTVPKSPKHVISPPPPPPHTTNMLFQPFMANPLISMSRGHPSFKFFDHE